MDTKALRQKILDLAIRGKLVPQDPNAEPASVLLERIREQKKQMVKEGKLKAKDIKNDTIIFVGEDNLHYEKFQDGTVKCIEDEIPFEVPEAWEWCRLNSIATFELGKTLDTAKNTGTYKPYLRSVNVRWNSIDLNDINCMKFEPDELARYSIKKGDLLICEGGDVGRSCVWEKNEEMYYQNALHRVRFYMNINPYFYMYIMMYYANSGKLQEICKGVTIKHLTRTTLLTLLFPLPPQNESLKKGYRNPTGFRRWVKVAKSSGLCYTYAMGTWKSKNRHKYLLQYHIIFVCKYRKKLLTSKQISDDIKQFSYEICQRYNVIIRHMETDKDHIHYMIETEPTMSVSKIVNLMKSYTTYHIWERYSTYLRKHFWKEHTFWTDGYFACSVGNVKEVYRKSRIEGQVAANVKSI
ncbi:MAG: IS200/IS605 family transposase [Monoglobales bacterium]